ncbi:MULTISPECIES: hypothetical protein [Pectobacterium]|uniref:hypothetical protein n=1 Tax=Pectobacterium TaxID=122277 RepID=UPI001CF7869C|nr:MULTISPECIES: hypothetical protein [Pectobacterium]
MKKLPHRDDLIRKIRALLSGDEDRSSVSEWAFDIYNDDSLKISDSLVSEYLELLGAVDLPSSDRDYLYTDDDFNEWLSDLNHK